jgi:hypothetical protein
MKTNNLKLERLSSAIERCEKLNAQLAEELSAKVTQLSSRLAGKKIINERIQEMIDSQCITVRNFEARLANLRKLLTEKEAQFMNASDALTDAHKEIERLRGHHQRP